MSHLKSCILVAYFTTQWAHANHQCCYAVMRGHCRHVTSLYNHFKHGMPAGNMVSCGSTHCDSLCACEGCHTSGNPSPIGGSVWNAYTITETYVNI